MTLTLNNLFELNDLNDLDLNDRIGMNWFNTDKRY